MLKLDSLDKSEETRIQVLASHDLFKRLNGNPYVIKALAAFYKNPFVHNADLKDIYHRLLKIDENVEDYNPLTGSMKLRADELKSMTSKSVEVRGKGIEAVLSFLKEKSQDPQ